MNFFEGRTTGQTTGQTIDFTRMGRQAAPAVPVPADFTRFVTEGLLRPLFEGLNTAATNFADSVAPSNPPATQGRTSPHRGHHRHHRDCGCGRRHEDEDDDCCEEHGDPCHCHCCIVDADLVVYARVGETRVIPLTIENKWRRERKIKTELSDWTSRGGTPAPVKAELLPPAPEFTLPPCGHQNLVMVARIDSPTTPGPNELERAPRLSDVDNCTVYYADLRVTGCDIRAVRIALAVLPRDCNTYEIECGCRCC